MENIRVILKPNSITYDDIHDLLFYAHTMNRENGLNVKTAEMKGNELEKHIGTNGECFVALSDDQFVGVTAVRIVNRNIWYAKGVVADQILVAVHPNYTGKHISSRLHEAVLHYCKDHGITQIELRTAASNHAMQKACLKWGFHHIDYKYFPGLDHYTVVMMKWISHQPSKILINGYYWLKLIQVKLRYRR